MPTIVQFGNHGTLEFPDSMSEDEVEKTVKRDSAKILKSFGDEYREKLKAGISQPDPTLLEGMKAYASDVLANIGTAAERGGEQAAAARAVRDNDIQEISRAVRAQQQLEASESYKRFTESGSYSDGVKALIDDPTGALSEVTAESMASSIPELLRNIPKEVGGKMAAGAALGSVTGPGATVGATFGAGFGWATAVGKTTYDLEYGGQFIEELQRAGVDVGDEAALRKALGNKDLVKRADRIANAKAITIAAFDMASLGFAGKTVGAPVRSALGKLAKTFAEMAAQGSVAGMGEVAGQATTGRPQDPGAVLAEIVGEGVSSLPEIAVGAARVVKPGTPALTSPKSAAPPPAGITIPQTEEAIGAQFDEATAAATPPPEPTNLIRDDLQAQVATAPVAKSPDLPTPALTAEQLMQEEAMFAPTPAWQRESYFAEDVEQEPIKNYGASFPKLPETVATAADLVDFRERRKAAEIEFLKSLGLDDKKAARMWRAFDARSETDVSDLEAALPELQRERLEAFAMDQTGYVWDRRFDPTNPAFDTSVEDAARSLVANIAEDGIPTKFGDKLLHAAVAIQRIKELGGTWEDVAKSLDRLTTRISGSQSDKEAAFRQLGEDLKQFARQQGIELPVSNSVVPAPLQQAATAAAQAGAPLTAQAVVSTAATPLPKPVVDTPAQAPVEGGMYGQQPTKPIDKGPRVLPLPMGEGGPSSGVGEISTPRGVRVQDPRGSGPTSGSPQRTAPELISDEEFAPSPSRERIAKTKAGKLLIKYRYTNPNPAGPFTGTMEGSDQIGDTVQAVFGPAVVTGQIRKKKLTPIEVEEIYRAEVDEAVGKRRQHRKLIEEAMQTGRPVSAAAVDQYGIKLPAGYVREGDRYVFKGGEQPNAQKERLEEGVLQVAPSPTAPAPAQPGAGVTESEIVAGDTIRWEPNANERRYQRSVEGVVIDIISNTEGERGYHIFSPTESDPSNVVRVWSNRGKVVSRTPRVLEKQLVPPDGLGKPTGSTAPQVAGENRPAKRPKTVVEIADEIAAQNIDPQSSYGLFVKARDLKPEISAKEWLPIYRQSLELARLRPGQKAPGPTAPAPAQPGAGEVEFAVPPNIAEPVLPKGQKFIIGGNLFEFTGKVDKDGRHEFWQLDTRGKPKMYAGRKFTQDYPRHQVLQMMTDEKFTPSVFTSGEPTPGSTLRAAAKKVRSRKAKPDSGAVNMMIFPGLDKASADALYNLILETVAKALDVAAAIAQEIAKLRTSNTIFDEQALRDKLATDIAAKEAVTDEQVKARAELNELGAEIENLKPKKTKVLGGKKGVYDTVWGPNTAEKVNEPNARELAQRAFNQAGVKVELQPNGLFKPVDEPNESGGRKLLAILKEEIAKASAGKTEDKLATLTTSLALYLRFADKAFSPALNSELYRVAQGERSYLGTALGAMGQFGKVLMHTAQNVRGELIRVMSGVFHGDELSKVSTIIEKFFLGEFSEKGLTDIGSLSEKLQKLLEALAKNAQQDSGGKVYRAVQAKYGPKAPKSKKAKEQAAKDEEAINAVIERAKALGIPEPVDPPNKKLTPEEKLALMTKRETQAKIQKAIDQALAEAEFNAGWAQMIEDAGSDAELRADLEMRRDAGEDPDTDAVERGLAMPKFSHWKTLRDNTVGYSPTTVKLVQDFISGRFKGTKFSEQESKKVADDTKIDLTALAKSPDIEVARVVDAQLAAASEILDASNANAATRQRVLEFLKQNLAEQVEKKREAIRERILKGDDVTYEQKADTPEEQAKRDAAAQKRAQAAMDRLSEAINVNTDPEALAKKGAVARILPTMQDLIKEVITTSAGRQADLAKMFADAFVNQLNIDPDAARMAANVIAKGYERKFKEAKKRALEKALARLETPDGPQLRKRDPMWKRVEELVNAGGFDTSEIIAGLADDRGWKLPPPEEVQRMRELSEREQELRRATDTLTEREAMARNTAERNAIIKELKTRWAKMSRPVSLRGWRQSYTWQNIGDMIAEYSSANALATLAFATKQLVDVGTQIAIHTPAKAIAQGWEQYQRGANKATFVKTVSAALADALDARMKAFKGSVVSAREGLRGNIVREQILGLDVSVSALDRLLLQAKELDAQGKPVQALMARIIALPRLAFNVATMFDEFQGRQAEAQSIRGQLVTGFLEQGLDLEAARQKARGVSAEIMANFLDAYALTEGIPEKQRKNAAVSILRAMAYDKMQELGLQADQFEAENQFERELLGWNLPEAGGPGAWVAAGIKEAGRGAAKLGPAGIPIITAARFHNAIAIGTNMAIRFSPLGFSSTLFEGSPWYGEGSASEQQRRKIILQRRVEAAAGTAAYGVILALAAAGVMRVFNRWPDDKEEKDLWEKMGRRPGTVEFDLGDLGHYKISLNTGPAAMVRPAFAAVGSLQDAAERRAKRNQKLKDRAVRGGVRVAPEDLTGKEVMSALMEGAFSAALGGRTASGLLGSQQSYGKMDINKMVASPVRAITPFAPMAGQLAMLAGSNVDPKLASAVDFALPMPWSPQKKNFFGDKVENESDVNRIFSVLTGGTALISKPDSWEKPYRILYKTNWRPPSVSETTTYNFNGTLKPLTPDQYRTFMESRGQIMKKKIAGLEERTVTEKKLDDVADDATKAALEKLGAKRFRVSR